MTPTKSHIEKTAREIYAANLDDANKRGVSVAGCGWSSLSGETKARYRAVARWHLAQIAKADKVSEREKVMRDILEQIATTPRRDGRVRLASSCLTFLDAMEKAKSKKKGTK